MFWSAHDSRRKKKFASTPLLSTSECSTIYVIIAQPHSSELRGWWQHIEFRRLIGSRTTHTLSKKVCKIVSLDWVEEGESHSSSFTPQFYKDMYHVCWLALENKRHVWFDIHSDGRVSYIISLQWLLLKFSGSQQLLIARHCVWSIFLPVWNHNFFAKSQL